MDFSVFEEGSAEQTAPSMLMNTGTDIGMDRREWRHRTARFEMGGTESEDQIQAYDGLMDRVIGGDVTIRSEKDSISATTGLYTCIVKYMERVTRREVQDA